MSARGLPITRQTGQVLTPTAAPDGDQIAFLSDSGGHADLWVTSTRNGDSRQITFEDNADAVGGCAGMVAGRRLDRLCVVEGPSPFRFGVWVVNGDGSNLRNLAKSGLGMAWSPDGKLCIAPTRSRER